MKKNAAKREKEAAQRQANLKYWNEHAELKKELLQKRENAYKELNDLKNQIDYLSNSIKEIKNKPYEYSTIRNEISDQEN